MSAATSRSSSSTTTLVNTDVTLSTSSTPQPLMTTDRRSCQDSKDALCRRMGALFLRHRVEQLSDDVEKMKQKSGASACRTGGKRNDSQSSSCPVQRRMQRCRGERRNGHKALEAAGFSAQTDSTSDESGSERLPMQSSLHEQSADILPMLGGMARKVIVADASLLIYSLRTVHEWLKAGDCRVVIPCEALSTLDVLKKGEHVLNLAARRATRFLDERFSALETVGHDHTIGTPASGLFPQSVQQREDLQSEAIRTKLISIGANVDAIDSAPLHVRRTVSCFVHFALQARKVSLTENGATCSIAIALPPPHLDLEDLSGPDKATLRYAERANGNLVMQCIKSLGLTDADDQASPKLIIAPTAASWLTAQSTPEPRAIADQPYYDHHLPQRQDHHHPHHHHQIHRHARHANARQC